MREDRFHAWAAAVRACVAIQALAQQSWEEEQALEHLLRSPDPDPAAIGRLTLDLRAHRLEIERLIGALPTLDEIGRTGETGSPGPALVEATGSSSESSLSSSQGPRLPATRALRYGRLGRNPSQRDRSQPHPHADRQYQRCA